MDGSGPVAASKPIANLPERLQGLLASLLKYTGARLQLLQYELRQEGAEIGALLARGVLLIIGALMSLQLLAFGIIAAFWNTPWRLHVIGVLMLTVMALTWAAWQSLRRQQARAALLLHRTVGDLGRELERDFKL